MLTYFTLFSASAEKVPARVRPAGFGRHRLLRPRRRQARQGQKADNCTGMAAAKCEKGMAGPSMAGMPACCRAKMAAAKATAPVKADKVAMVKSL
ncbi:MAG: hypothetical protein WKG07_30035 [Hymenobacter sp.]